MSPLFPSGCLLKKIVMFVLCSAVLMLCAQVASAQIPTYTNDTNLADFTEPITVYATFSNFNMGDTTSPFTPNASTVAQGLRIYSGTLPATGAGGNGLPTAVNGQPNNWIEATFPTPVSTIVVFPNIDHLGLAYDGFQYSIAGSIDGVTWTVLYDALSVTGAGEPFTLTGSSGSAPTKVNNVLAVGSGQGPGGTVGYIAQFTFGKKYKYYAFGASTVAAGNNPSPNTDQELTAVGATVRNGVFPPTSGALLTITDGGATNVFLYDSQVHTGLVEFVPTGGTSSCNASDATVPTDAHVAQGKSSTGCDAGDGFEVTDTSTAGSLTQRKAFGHADVDPTGKPVPQPAAPGSGFHIETHYICAGKCSDGVSGNDTVCNTNGNICIGSAQGQSPDNGFVTVTNNTKAAFNGTIMLQGTSPLCGAVSDSVNGSLAPGSSVTLALGNDGTKANPGTLDASSCGGFTADQISAALVTGTPVTFYFGANSFQVMPTGSVIPGDQLTFHPTPVPTGQFGSISCPGNILPSLVDLSCIPAAASPVNVPLACASAADFAAPAGANVANPVCPELEIHCLNPGGTNGYCNDGESFFFSTNYTLKLDPNAGYPVVSGNPEIGGVHLLGEKGTINPVNPVSCPQQTYNVDPTFSVFTGDIGMRGTGTNCYTAAWDPTQPAPAANVTLNVFSGPLQPLSGTQRNNVKVGTNEPIKFGMTNGGGGPPLTNLSYCSDPKNPGAGPIPCVALLMTPPTPQPCGPAALPDANTTTPLTTGTAFMNLGVQTINGQAVDVYQFNWNTKGLKGGKCTTVFASFSFGLYTQVASFALN